MEKVKPPHSSTSVPYPKPVPNKKLPVPKQDVNTTPITANTELKAFVPELDKAPEPDNKPKMPTDNTLNEMLPYIGVGVGILLVVKMMNKKK
jgi:hypothetical protein